MARQAMKKQRQRRKVNTLSSAIVYQGNIESPTQIEIVQYDATSVQSKALVANAIPVLKQEEGTVTWVKTSGLSNAEYINTLCRSYGLHSFDIRDLMSFQDVVKVVVYEEVSFVLIPVFNIDSANEFNSIQAGFILGDGFVVSMQEAEISILEDVKKLLENKTVTARQKPTSDVLLYTLLNAVNAQNLATILKMEDQLLDIEELLIANDDSATNTMTSLRQHRLNYIMIKRSLLSIREEYNNLLRKTNKLIHEANVIYFNDFDDKIRTSLGDLETCHELLSSLLDLYYSNTNLRMNEIMKRLTIVSTIFIPLTFLVGVWGMNFKFMPELDWKYGYLTAWGIFFVVVLVVLYLMKRKKWF